MFGGASLGRRSLLDMRAAAPEPVPDGLDDAAARVGKSEDIKAMREQFGLAPDNSFPEQADVDFLKEHGQLTPEDMAELEAADTVAADADAYGKALMTAVRCAFGA